MYICIRNWLKTGKIMKKYVKPQVAVYVIESQLLQFTTPDVYNETQQMMVNPDEEYDGEVL